MTPSFWAGKRVLITGHNGFKGTWLCKWLDMLGAETFGYALKPDQYSVYGDVKFSTGHNHIEADVRDYSSLKKTVDSFQPQIVYHLAAQAIVREASVNPHMTFETNVMGTVNLLESLRGCGSITAAVLVTSDKVYKNIETVRAYRETDPLGGSEPYSCSKACQEHVACAYRNTYFKSNGTGIATARASNVYGGADNHFDRLIPYLIKTDYEKREAGLRSPGSIRPWQYVLDLLRGYLTLGESLYLQPDRYAEEWNFGPPDHELYTVGQIAEIIAGGCFHSIGKSFHEDGILLINSDKSAERLGWTPVYSLSRGLSRTKEFYAGYFQGRPVDQLMESEIYKYLSDVKETENG